MNSTFTTPTNYASLRHNTSWRDVNNLKSSLLFNRFNSSGLCIAPSCKQHTERPGAFFRSARARGSFRGRIYRHPEQRFKGNICNNLWTHILTRLCFRLSELFFSALAQESLFSWATAVNNAEIIFENVNILTRDIQVRFHTFLFLYRLATSDFEFCLHLTSGVSKFTFRHSRRMGPHFELLEWYSGARNAFQLPPFPFHRKSVLLPFSQLTKQLPFFSKRKPHNSSSTVGTTRWKVLRTLPFSPSIIRWCSCHQHLSSLMI